MISFILMSHFIADFMCQTDWQAKNKSKSLIALTGHVLSYMYVMLTLIATSFAFNKEITTNGILIYILINGLLHFVTDFCTSKVTSYLWQQERRHDFFVVVGFDQFIHQVCLISTIWMLYR